MEKFGFVGLPNAGKSSLFNALAGGGALAAPYPFATKDPNVGRAKVPDARRLSRLLGGVGVRSIRTWDAAGKLPRPIRLGARVVWSIREIKSWLAAGAPDRATWERLKAGRRP